MCWQAGNTHINSIAIPDINESHAFKNCKNAIGYLDFAFDTKCFYKVKHNIRVTTKWWRCPIVLSIIALACCCLQ